MNNTQNKNTKQKSERGRDTIMTRPSPGGEGKNVETIKQRSRENLPHELIWFTHPQQGPHQPHAANQA